MTASEAVLRMITDNTAPTAPLDEFIAAYAEDDNWWWMLSCGHHQNLFEEAVERIETLEASSRLPTSTPDPDARSRDE